MGEAMRYLIIPAVAVLVGCATQPEKIQAAYISPIQYGNYDCSQLGAESARVTRRANDLYGQLNKLADNDAAQMGVGLILFWPTLFFLEGGDGPEAQEYARLKGERDAIEQARIQKRCGFEFQPVATRQFTALPVGSRWVGNGNRDTCGEPWSADLTVADGKVRGMIERGGVTYDVFGDLDTAGDLERGRAGKNQASKNLIGPRFLSVNLDFGPDNAFGSYAIDAYGRLTCQTPLALSRVAQ